MTFVRNVSPHQRVLLELVETSHRELLEASRVYTEHLIKARDSGLPYTALAEAVGMTETAVRTYLKRRNQPLPEAAVRDGEIVDTCLVCGDIFNAPDKGLGRAMHGAWRSRHHHIERGAR